MQAVHFGAGNIGRGFIGLVLFQSGFEVCFVDINETIVKRLNEQREYTVIVANESYDTFVVRRVKALHGDNMLLVAQAIAEADLVTTAIGVNNLEYVANTIAEGIVLRSKHSAGPMQVIACENGINASSRLKEYVFNHLSTDVQTYAESMVCFPNAMVDRIVPNQPKNGSLNVLVEPYYEWVVERCPDAQRFPTIIGVRYVDNLQPYLERKLFTVNTGHCAAAYLGYLKGYTTIQDAMRDPDVKNSVLQVLNETSAVLCQRYHFDHKEQQDYVRKTLDRFSNPRLSDEVTRIGRSPIRKLARDERLVSPTLQAYAHNVQPEYLTLAIAAALRFDYEADGEAARIQSFIKAEGIEKAIEHFTSIPESHPLHAMILNHYHNLSRA